MCVYEIIHVRMYMYMVTCMDYCKHVMVVCAYVYVLIST